MEKWDAGELRITLEPIENKAKIYQKELGELQEGDIIYRKYIKTEGIPFKIIKIKEIRFEKGIHLTEGRGYLSYFPPKCRNEYVLQNMKTEEIIQEPYNTEFELLRTAERIERNNRVIQFEPKDWYDNLRRKYIEEMEVNQPNMKYTKEIELIDAFCKSLDENKCEYKREVRKGSYHNEGYYDIIIKKNNFYIAVEANLHQFQKVYRQACRNRVLCDLSYVLYPRKPKDKDIIECKKNDVGIIIPDKGSFLYLVKSRPSTIRFNKEKIARNWREDRIGRIINKKEIPSNYDENKIENLKPKYDWVEKQELRRKESIERKELSSGDEYKRWLTDKGIPYNNVCKLNFSFRETLICAFTREVKKKWVLTKKQNKLIDFLKKQ